MTMSSITHSRAKLFSHPKKIVRCASFATDENRFTGQFEFVTVCHTLIQMIHPLFWNLIHSSRLSSFCFTIIAGNRRSNPGEKKKRESNITGGPFSKKGVIWPEGEQGLNWMGSKLRLRTSHLWTQSYTHDVLGHDSYSFFLSGECHVRPWIARSGAFLFPNLRSQITEQFAINILPPPINIHSQFKTRARQTYTQGTFRCNFPKSCSLTGNRESWG